MSSEGPDSADRRRSSAMGADDDEASPSELEYVHLRRTPRYGRFMIAGCLVFALIALISSFAFSVPGEDQGAVFGFLLVVGLFVGVLVGGVAALVVERLTRRRLVQAHRTRGD